jgi:hypothetical protein
LPTIERLLPINPTTSTPDLNQPTRPQGILPSLTIDIATLVGFVSPDVVRIADVTVIHYQLVTIGTLFTSSHGSLRKENLKTRNTTIIRRISEKLAKFSG